MVRCKEFYDKLERLKAEGDQEKLKQFCDKSYDMMQEIEKHMDFMKLNLPTIVGSPADIPEGATRPIRRETPEVQEKVIPKMLEAVQKGEEVTAPKVQQWINEAKNPDFYASPIPTECKEDVCPTCQPLSLKEEFCPICPKNCDYEAVTCPVIVFIKWRETH